MNAKASVSYDGNKLSVKINDGTQGVQQTAENEKQAIHQALIDINKELGISNPSDKP